MTDKAQPNRTGLNKFYLGNYPNVPGRSLLPEDFGSMYRISGVVFQGMGHTSVFMLPASITLLEGDEKLIVVYPDAGEWTEIIKRTDDPQEFALDADGFTKVLQRKAASAIHASVQQYVWARDNFACVFCGRRMGTPHVILSIDHWMPLELGGANAESNYLTACTTCNKNKGMMHPEAFCKKYKHDYAAIGEYLATVSGGI